MTDTAYIEKHKIICICRRLYGSDLLRLSHALFDGGIRMMEVTFDQADPNCNHNTAKAIEMLVREFKGEMHFGAGTVLSCDQIDVAKAAGAEYIISPNTNVDVIRYTKKAGLLSIPGAMTPSEIITAHENGADFVKLFPTGYLGLSYVKDILGPISHVKLLATGGINEENLEQYLNMGLVGAGISGRLTERKLIETQNFEEFTTRARTFAAIANTPIA